MRKYLEHSIIAIFIACLGLASCQPPPDFPETPKIKFLSLEEVDDDNIIITFEFEDGNADLGLRSTQTNFPFNEYNYITAGGDTIAPPIQPGTVIVDSVKNFYFSNLFLFTFVKRNGDFEEAWYGINVNGQEFDTIFRPDLRFPPVTDKVEDQPVSGTIAMNVSTRFFPWRFEDTLRFEFFVSDRSLNHSNRVKTSTYNKP